MSVTDLTGRVAIVTGAGAGIGQATSRALAEAGATVIVGDIDGASLDWCRSDPYGERYHPLAQDVTSEEDWRAVIDVAERLGRLDILVNNAGIMLDTPFTWAPVEDLRRQYRINVEGPFLGMQAALPLLEQRRLPDGSSTASIINISSIYGQVAGDRYAAYSATKGAIRMLSKAVAVESASRGVRVNSVHPGPTLTKLGANHETPADDEGNALPVEQILAGWTSRIPMRRMGDVSDIAPVVTFLAGDGARYITGAEIVIDGGYTAI